MSEQFCGRRRSSGFAGNAFPFARHHAPLNFTVGSRLIRGTLAETGGVEISAPYDRLIAAGTALGGDVDE